MTGRPLAEVVPEMGQLLQTVRNVRGGRPFETQIIVTRGKETRSFLVRIGVEQDGHEIKGFVVTFDDVSELLAAQRKAAWADVARRIAHEIKNPLTPIQLSAERLKRKYVKEISSDQENFVTCTDTLVRPVGAIGRMVEECSSLSRMPVPAKRPEHMLCRRRYVEVVPR